MGIAINRSNYAYWKRIASIVFDETIAQLPTELKPEDYPMAILDKWEQHSEALARRGLQEGMRDAISELTYCSVPVLERLDRRLRAEGLPGVLALQAIAKDTLGKVLRSGRIRSSEQYYIVKDRLDDVSLDLSNHDRSELNRILGDYEASNRSGVL